MPPRGRSSIPKTPAPSQSQGNVSASISRTRSMSRARVKAVVGSLSARSLSRVRPSTAKQLVPPASLLSAPVPAEKAPYGSGGAKYFSSSQVLTSHGVFVQPDNLSDYKHTGNSANIYAFPGSEDPDFDKSSDYDSDKARAKRATKSQSQWSAWSDTIIPQLLQPYMTLMQETASLRDMDNIRKLRKCTGCVSGRQISVQCIFFNSKYFCVCYICLELITKFTEIETIILCTCTQPALQLLACGLFPCAPLFPTLAVDLQMLDFVQKLFVNTAPNLTAWCDTLESFLDARKFKLTTRVCGLL